MLVTEKIKDVDHWELTLKRPDFSEYVVHFTKDDPPWSLDKKKDTKNQVIKKQAMQAISLMKARDRLFEILKAGLIKAFHQPYSNPAVCFSECTWSSLLAHAKRYSHFGIGFKKSFLFKKGGGPAIYLSSELWERQKKSVGEGNQIFDHTLGSFITPFNPEYSTEEYRKKYWNVSPVDYSHEREWRVPKDLDFSLSDVDFVIVDGFEDIQAAPSSVRSTIHAKNWLSISNYQRIEELWPPYLKE